jgi:exonuclease VII large subunit
MGAISEFLSPLTNKIMLVLVLAGGIAAGLFFWQFRTYEAKYDEAKGQLTSTQADLKEAQTTLTRLKQSQTISAGTRGEIASEAQGIQTKTDSIQDTAKKKVAQIQQDYASKPKTPENQQAEANAVATVRINSMWDTFCLSGTTHEQCRVQPAASAASGS